jgi:hypothetical protein
MWGGLKRGYLEEVTRLGLLNYVDAVSFHMYNYKLSFAERSAEAWVKLVQGTEDMLKSYNGGKPVPIYVTEQGRPTPPGSAELNELSQARYLTRVHLLAQSLPCVDGTWWYTRQDRRKSNGSVENFGLRRMDGMAKPSYTALSVMQKSLQGYRLDRRLTTGLSGGYNPDTDYVLRFVNPANGATKLAAWTTAYAHSILVPATSSSASATWMLGGGLTLGKSNDMLVLPLTQGPKYVP